MGHCSCFNLEPSQGDLHSHDGPSLYTPRPRGRAICRWRRHLRVPGPISLAAFCFHLPSLSLRVSLSQNAPQLYLLSLHLYRSLLPPTFPSTLNSPTPKCAAIIPFISAPTHAVPPTTYLPTLQHESLRSTSNLITFSALADRDR